MQDKLDLDLGAKRPIAWGPLVPISSSDLSHLYLDEINDEKVQFLLALSVAESSFVSFSIELRCCLLPTLYPRLVL